MRRMITCIAAILLSVGLLSAIPASNQQAHDIGPGPMGAPSYDKLA